MKRKLKIFAVIVLCLFVACILFFMITNLVVVGSTKDSIFDVNTFIEEHEGEKYDCIIVLGCGVYSDGTPTPMLNDRIEVAVDLYNAGFAPKILMSGDHYKENYNEVFAMRARAMELHVPSEDIFLDHAGLSTYDSMYRASNIFQIENAIVVTQEYHLSRSLYLAKSMGIDAVGVIADGHVFIEQPYYSFREVLARSKDFMKCIFKPSSSIGGEVIDMSGSGEVTLGEP